MSKHDESARPRAPAPELSRRTRLHRLLFAGATFGTTLVMLVGTLEPKKPPIAGE